MLNKIDQLMESARQEAARVDQALAKSSSYAEIAGFYLKAGQTTRCLEALTEGLKVADTLKKPEEKARQLAWIARIFLCGGRVRPVTGAVHPGSFAGRSC